METRNENESNSSNQWRINRQKSKIGNENIQERENKIFDIFELEEDNTKHGLNNLNRQELIDERCNQSVTNQLCCLRVKLT